MHVRVTLPSNSLKGAKEHRCKVRQSQHDENCNYYMSEAIYEELISTQAELMDFNDSRRPVILTA